MKYISIDTETLGLDSDKHSLIQVGAILEDTELRLPFEKIPKFEMLIEHELYCGTPFAMAMHGKLFKKISDIQKERSKAAKEALDRGDYEFQTEGYGGLCKPNHLAYFFNIFLQQHLIYGEKLNVAGKNYNGFDKNFLNKVPDWSQISINHRAIDPAVLFADFHSDKEMPGLDLCKERAGLSGEVAHTVLEDAWDVIQLLRKRY